VFDYQDLLPFIVAFFSLLAAGMGAPIPEELPIIGAGLWAATQTGPTRWLILLVCIIGVVVSDGILYCIGRQFGVRLLNHRFFRRFVPPEKRARIEANFHHYGVRILLIARLLPGIRAPMFVMAGVMRLPLGRFLLADGIYAIPGVSLLFFLSYAIGDQFRDVVEGVQHWTGMILLVLLLLVAAYMLYNFLRRPVSTGDPEELPIIGPQVAAHMAQKTEVLHSVPPPTAPEPETEAEEPRPV
jgi:membrane protein DedA with SNARE-associated domain